MIIVELIVVGVVVVSAASYVVDYRIRQRQRIEATPDPDGYMHGDICNTILCKDYLLEEYHEAGIFLVFELEEQAYVEDEERARVEKLELHREIMAQNTRNWNKQEEALRAQLGSQPGHVFGPFDSLAQARGAAGAAIGGAAGLAGLGAFGVGGQAVQ